MTTMSKSKVTVASDEFAQQLIADMFSNNAYNDPIKAVLREYSANGLDAIRDAGKNSPVHVELPGPYNNNTLTITDDGIGMSLELMEQVFPSFVSSTKRNNDADPNNEIHRSEKESIGKFGIGAKSGYALAKSFVVTSVHDGMRTTMMFTNDDEGGKSKNTLFHGATEDPSGTKVSIVIPEEHMVRLDYGRRNAWNTAAQAVFGWWNPEDFSITNGENGHTLPITNYNDQITWLDDTHGVSSGRGYAGDGISKDYVNVSGLVYPIPNEFINEVMDKWTRYPQYAPTNKIIIKASKDDVDIMFSREELVMNSMTKVFIRRELEKLQKLYNEHLQSEIDRVLAIEDKADAKTEFIHLTSKFNVNWAASPLAAGGHSLKSVETKSASIYWLDNSSNDNLKTNKNKYGQSYSTSFDDRKLHLIITHCGDNDVTKLGPKITRYGREHLNPTCGSSNLVSLRLAEPHGWEALHPFAEVVTYDELIAEDARIMAANRAAAREARLAEKERLEREKITMDAEMRAQIEREEEERKAAARAASKKLTSANFSHHLSHACKGVFEGVIELDDIDPETTPLIYVISSRDPENASHYDDIMWADPNKRLVLQHDRVQALRNGLKSRGIKYVDIKDIESNTWSRRASQHFHDEYKHAPKNIKKHFKIGDLERDGLFIDQFLYLVRGATVEIKSASLRKMSESFENVRPEKMANDLFSWNHVDRYHRFGEFLMQDLSLYLFIDEFRTLNNNFNEEKMGKSLQDYVVEHLNMRKVKF